MKHSFKDQLLLAETAIWLVIAKVSLAIFPPHKVTASVDLAHKGREFCPTMPRRTRWAVETCSQHLPLKFSHLEQAMAACWILQARSFAPQLHHGPHPRVTLNEVPVVGHPVGPEL